MIPFGSVGGCHRKVTEEAVTFVKVTFCGGSSGSERQVTNVERENVRLTSEKSRNKLKRKEKLSKMLKQLFSTCIGGGEADVDHHSSISQPGPAGHGGIVATLCVDINYY